MLWSLAPQARLEFQLEWRCTASWSAQKHGVAINSVPAKSELERTALHTVEPIQWTAEGVVILDQLKLPGEVVYHTYTDYRDVAHAIKTMIIRGAPAIGVAAAMGVAIGVQRSKAKTLGELQAEFPIICDALATTR